MKTRAYSLWQPWASVVFVPGLKPIETRHWKTGYRGPLAIHAAKNKTGDLVDFFNDKRLRPENAASLFKAGLNTFDDLPLGAIIGTVDLVDCVPTAPACDAVIPLALTNSARFAKFCHPGMWPTVEQWGDFSPGRFGHCFANIRKFDEPIPYKGAQGFFNVEVPA